LDSFMQGYLKNTVYADKNPWCISTSKEIVYTLHWTWNEIKYGLYVCKAINITHTETYYEYQSILRVSAHVKQSNMLCFIFVEVHMSLFSDLYIYFLVI
jgi:hypothetical protein